WTEWELVRHATARFPGHRQPRVPSWGYVDEADPKVMEAKIDVAADHGIDYWIFDWYWYDDGPYLSRCLEEGYLRASNSQRVRFCCMWANHDWIDIHPAKYVDPRRLLYPGRVTPQTFGTMVEHILNTYFAHPAYFTVEGRPYFSIYELEKLVESFGGVAQTREALDHFRARTRAVGFPDLHLNAVVWGQPVLPGEKTPADPRRLLADLGFDSFTSYVWVHHVPLHEFPETDYNHVRDCYFEYWDRAVGEIPLPYFPNATMGWDSSPRTVQSEVFRPVGYPFTPLIGGNTPERFREALRMVRDRLDARPAPRVLNINAWNEWTEGSYLEPDTITGLAYLRAVRDVFAG
ncbi:MAG TPA: glycoside hydrolase family 99-like domain-containing protein, partial [Armatimonadota bacterium]|nr:glycoside hydrolase family 99-like domain-containing protein [Armatimonadota bacterium]